MIWRRCMVLRCKRLELLALIPPDSCCSLWRLIMMFRRKSRAKTKLEELLHGVKVKVRRAKRRRLNEKLQYWYLQTKTINASATIQKVSLTTCFASIRNQINWVWQLAPRPTQRRNLSHHNQSKGEKRRVQSSSREMSLLLNKNRDNRSHYYHHLTALRKNIR